MGITREQVFQAADAIFSLGKNPTQAAVRSRLGQGSFATINKYLRDWREQNNDTMEARTIVEMPDAIKSNSWWRGFGALPYKLRTKS